MLSKPIKNITGEIAIGFKTLIIEARMMGTKKANNTKMINRICAKGRVRRTKNAIPVSIKNAAQKLGDLI